MMRALLIATLPAAAAAIALPAIAEDAASARVNYILHCSGCHGMQGLGTLEGGIPPFPDSIGHIVGSEIGRTYIMHVPGVITTDMSDAEIAAVMNYIIDEWSDGGEHFTAEEVTRRRAEPVGDVVEFRREVVAELRKSGIEIAEYPWP